MKILPLLLILSIAFSASAAETFKDRLDHAKTQLSAARREGVSKYMAELEAQGTALVKEFPSESAGYEMLVAALKNTPDSKRETLLKLVEQPGAPATVKTELEGLRRSWAVLGQAPEIAFTALDGSRVDLAQLKGKVVLLDFWATWCGPCVAELPNVKNAYDRLHDKGFEIIGISLDSDRTNLEQFVKEKQMPWPQFFDGNGWKNEISKKYGIRSIPAMWLVNKSGKVVDLNARGDLAGKVQKLLEE